LREVLDRWNSGWAYYARGDCYRDRGRKGRAAQSFRRALARRPGRRGDLVELRDLARARTDWDEAADYGQRLVDGYPIVTSYRLALGDIEVARGNYDRARSLYEFIIDQRPG
ncbi:MAG: tetratricopeptide repeat protein, partial [Bradymonadaceae bacterium]